MLASGSHDSTIKLWEVATGSRVTDAHRTFRGVDSVAFSTDGRFLLSWRLDTISSLAVDDGEQLASLICAGRKRLGCRHSGRLI